MAYRLPKTPQPLPPKMTLKCRGIDVKCAHSLYHMHVGLGKWTLDPTLIYRTLWIIHPISC